MDNLTILTPNTGPNLSTRLLTDPRLPVSSLELKQTLSLTTSNTVVVSNKDVVSKYVVHQPPESRSSNEGVINFEICTKNWSRADRFKLAVVVDANFFIRQDTANTLPIPSSGTFKGGVIFGTKMSSFPQIAYAFLQYMRARIWVAGQQVSPEEFNTIKHAQVAYLQSLPLDDIKKRAIAPLGLPYDQPWYKGFPVVQQPFVPGSIGCYRGDWEIDTVAEEAYDNFWGKLTPIVGDRLYKTKALIHIPLWVWSPFFYDKTLIPPNTIIQLQFRTDNSAEVPFLTGGLDWPNNIEGINYQATPFQLDYQQLIFTERTLMELSRLVSTKPIIYHGLFLRVYGQTEFKGFTDYTFTFNIQGGPIPSSIFLMPDKDIIMIGSLGDINHVVTSFELFNKKISVNGHMFYNDEREWLLPTNSSNLEGRDFFGAVYGLGYSKLASLKMVQNAPFQPTDMEGIEMELQGTLGYSRGTQPPPNGEFNIIALGFTPIYWSISYDGTLKRAFTNSPLHYGSIYFK